MSAWPPRYYTPTSAVLDVSGVRRSTTWRADVFIGSATDLVAAGLLRFDMLPGQPGNPLGSVRYRAVGGEGSRSNGHMTIYRNVSGLFRVEVIVGSEEIKRRKIKEADRLATRQLGLTQDEERAILDRRHQAAELKDRSLAAAITGSANRGSFSEGSLTEPNEALQTLGLMAVLHRRKLPAGWRVIVRTAQSTGRAT